MASLSFSRRIARILFSACERDSPARTCNPVGRWVRRIELLVLLRFCPPGPGPRNASNRQASSRTDSLRSSQRGLGGDALGSLFSAKCGLPSAAMNHPSSRHRACLLLALIIALPTWAVAGEKSLPGVDQLPPIPQLPDPFLFPDGTRCKTKEDWAQIGRA